MALTFKKNPAAVSEVQAAAPKQAGTLSWMKTGAAAKTAIAQNEAKAALRQEEMNSLRRFYLKEGQEASITFLDGALDDEGVLDLPRFHEHTIMINGKPDNFVCTAELDTTQPCPMCEGGDEPAFVAVATIINHTPYEIQSGPNEGKLLTNRKALFVGKRDTIAALTKLSKPVVGLAGQTFDVSRIGKKSPRVGSLFVPTYKWTDWDDFCAKYSLKDEDVTPANYEEEIKFRPAAELITLGIGKAVKGIGHEKATAGMKSNL